MKQQQTDDKDNKKMTIASKVYKLVMRNTPLWPTAVRTAEGWNNSPVLSNLKALCLSPDDLVPIDDASRLLVMPNRLAEVEKLQEQQEQSLATARADEADARIALDLVYVRVNLPPLLDYQNPEHRQAVENEVSQGRARSQGDILRVNTWRDATALATSKQDDVNQCAAVIDNFKASVREVTEELEHVVRECAKLDRSPGR